MYSSSPEEFTILPTLFLMFDIFFTPTSPKFHFSAPSQIANKNSNSKIFPVNIKFNNLSHSDPISLDANWKTF